MTKSTNKCPFLAMFFATGFFSGYLPKSPGTFGSIVCVVIWYFLQRAFQFANLTAILVLICAIVAYFSIKASLASVSFASEAKHDPSYIVIDEWCGMLIALLGISPSDHIGILWAFLLFRLFDISKPGPIGWVERAPIPYGIILDDVLAGIITAALLNFLR